MEICAPLMLQRVICFSPLNLQSEMCHNEGRQCSTSAFKLDVSKYKKEKRIFGRDSCVFAPAFAGLCGVFPRTKMTACVRSKLSPPTETLLGEMNLLPHVCPEHQHLPFSIDHALPKKRRTNTHDTFKLSPHLRS